MNNGGFIKLYRKIVDWEWYDDINTKTVFFHLLLTANYENKRWRGIELEAGSRIVSLHGLSDETGLSIWQVRRALSNLENTNEIIKQTTNRYTVVKLAKWADYQCNTTSKPQTNHKQTATDKEVKKERNKEKDQKIKTFCAEPENPASTPEAITKIDLPPVITFLLNDKSEYSITQEQVAEWSELYPAVDVMLELRNIKAWAKANPKKRKTKGGALRFVNGWLAREQDKGGTNARAAPVSFAEERRQQEREQDDAFEQVKRMMREGGARSG